MKNISPEKDKVNNIKIKFEIAKIGFEIAKIGFGIVIAIFTFRIQDKAVKIQEKTTDIQKQTAAIEEQTAQFRRELDKYQTEINTANLIQKLINDLTSQTTKQDLALIALRHTIVKNKEDAKNLMLIEICELVLEQQIHQARQGKKEGYVSNTAINILKERAPDKSKKWIEEVGLIRRENESFVFQTLKNNINKGLIYIHYKSRNQETRVEEFRTKLKRQGWDVPPIDLITSSSYKDDIRYFNSKDVDIAKQLKNIADQHFLKKFDLTNLSSRYPNVPNKQIEIWINE